MIDLRRALGELGAPVLANPPAGYHNEWAAAGLDPYDGGPLNDTMGGTVQVFQQNGQTLTPEQSDVLVAQERGISVEQARALREGSFGTAPMTAAEQNLVQTQTDAAQARIAAAAAPGIARQQAADAAAATQAAADAAAAELERQRVAARDAAAAQVIAREAALAAAQAPGVPEGWHQGTLNGASGYWAPDGLFYTGAAPWASYTPGSGQSISSAADYSNQTNPGTNSGTDQGWPAIPQTISEPMPPGWGGGSIFEPSTPIGPMTPETSGAQSAGISGTTILVVGAAAAALLLFKKARA